MVTPQSLILCAFIAAILLAGCSQFIGSYTVRPVINQALQNGKNFQNQMQQQSEKYKAPNMVPNQTNWSPNGGLNTAPNGSPILN